MEPNKRKRRRRRTTTTTMEDLSDDLIMKIIRLLPLKSIVLCLGVCKRLRSLINEGPFFLTNTCNVVRHFQDNRYICLPRDHGGGGMQDLEFSFSIKSSNKFPLSIKSSKNCLYNDQLVYDFEILASCNGLLIAGVIILDDLHKYYISNPWTRESIPLPQPSYTITRLSAWGLACENNPTNSNSRDDSSSIISNNNNVALYKIVVVHQIFVRIYRFEVYSSEKRSGNCLSQPSNPIVLLVN